MHFGKAVSFAVVGIASFPSAFAWGAAGHEIVATIAQIHLNPPVLPILCSILYPTTSPESCYLSSVAAWADGVRYRAGFRWSAPLHYVGGRGDLPSDTCLFPGDRGWAGREGGNVLGAIRNVTTILQDIVQDATIPGKIEPSAESKLYGGEMAQEALKFLIHFVGDLHMPLHLTGRDRGGNGVKVSWDGRVTNLHSLWDGRLIAKALRSIPSTSNYSHPLPIPGIEDNLRDAIYDPYVRKIMWEGVGVGSYSDNKARWEDEVEGWLDCPSAPTDDAPSAEHVGSFYQVGQMLKQTVLGLLPRRKPRGAPYDTDDASLCPYAWAAPIHQLNCDLVWPKELDEPPYGHAARVADPGEDVHCHEASCAEDELLALSHEEPVETEGRRGNYLELDTPEYAGRIEREWVVEKLLAMGGIRLAAVLNDIFDPKIEDGAGVTAF